MDDRDHKGLSAEDRKWLTDHGMTRLSYVKESRKPRTKRLPRKPRAGRQYSAAEITEHGRTARRPSTNPYLWGSGRTAKAAWWQKGYDEVDALEQV